MSQQGSGRAREGKLAALPPAFVGRDGELASVLDALGEGPALVLVEGEAGIGKTRLVREALASVSDRTVLVAACPPVAEPFPLGAVADGLRRLRDDVRDVKLTALGGALRPLFPEWAEQLPPALETPDDPAETRHRLFRALAELVERLGVETLVVEDAHWADVATLEWLLALPTLRSAHPSVVVTFRPTDVPAGSLLRRLAARPPEGMAQVRVGLDPLEVEQVGQLVGSMLGTGEVSGQFAGFLHEHSGGVPFAAEELVRLLRERHDIARKGGRWTRRVVEDLRVPPTVRDSILERVERLDADTVQMLRAAAVLAEPAEEQLLTTVAGLVEQAGRVALAAGLGSGLLREAAPFRYGFCHALASKAVEEEVPVSERRRLHQRAAAALDGLDPAPVVHLARHYRGAGDTDQWCHYAEAAADVAWESGDDRTAITVLHELLTTAEHPGQRRARLARKLGEAADRGPSALGDRAGQLAQTLRQVLACADVPADARGELRLWLGRVLYQSGQMEAAYAEIEAAVPQLEDRPELACRAMMLLGTPLVPGWPAARHRQWIERATALLPRVESRSDQLLLLLHNRATALLLLGEEAGWAAAAELPRSAPTASEQRVIAAKMHNIGQLAIVWGRYDDARRQLDAAVELSRTSGYQRALNSTLVARTRLDWCTGTWEGLAERARGLAEAEETEPPAVRLDARQVQGLVELATGARGSAEQRLRQVAGELGRRGVVNAEVALSAAGLGRMALADDEPSKALPVTEPVMVMIFQKQVWLWASDIAPVHVEALVAAGQGKRAEEMVAAFAGWLAGRDAPAPVAALTMCRATLAEATVGPEPAAELFDHAASAWAVLPRPYDELLARERQGRCLLAADRPDLALEVLSETQRRLQELGARWDADRVARLLRQLGVEVVRTWRRGPKGYGDELSPREREVLALVARGMTSREAGEALFLSARTIDRHVNRAMRKLAVSSRTELAVAATEAGLIPPKHPETGGPG